MDESVLLEKRIKSIESKLSKKFCYLTLNKDDDYSSVSTKSLFKFNSYSDEEVCVMVDMIVNSTNEVASFKLNNVSVYSQKLSSLTTKTSFNLTVNSGLNTLEIDCQNTLISDITVTIVGVVSAVDNNSFIQVANANNKSIISIFDSIKNQGKIYDSDNFTLIMTENNVRSVSVSYYKENMFAFAFVNSSTGELYVKIYDFTTNAVITTFHYVVMNVKKVCATNVSNKGAFYILKTDGFVYRYDFDENVHTHTIMSNDDVTDIFSCYNGGKNYIVIGQDKKATLCFDN